MAYYHNQGDVVRSTTDHQGLEKGAEYVVTRRNTPTSPLGPTTYFVRKSLDPNAPELRVINGHMLLERVRSIGEVERGTSVQQERLNRMSKLSTLARRSEKRSRQSVQMLFEDVERAVEWWQESVLGNARTEASIKTLALHFSTLLESFPRGAKAETTLMLDTLSDIEEEYLSLHVFDTAPGYHVRRSVRLLSEAVKVLESLITADVVTEIAK